MDMMALLAQKKPLLMGILNITPDSFHDGGCFLTPEKALAQLKALTDAGADIIDIGGASSRPGHTPVDAETELARILPVLELARDCPVPLSLDTDKAAVAAAGLQAGCQIINYTGGRLDEEIFSLAAAGKAPLVVMHCQGEAGRHEDICGEVAQFFRDNLALGRKMGLGYGQIILDPGFGFNKNLEENLALLHELPRLRAFKHPLLLGFSHKRFVAALSGEAPGQAPAGNQALALYALLHQAELLRMHDIAETAALIRAARPLFRL